MKKGKNVKKGKKGKKATKGMDGGKPLAGRVALVAGATRGAGRGIARGLAEAGAFVYCTGRSVPGAPSAYGRPETIDETAELITAAGGRAVAVRVDHTVAAEVEALLARIARDHGRLDVCVNSVAGEDPMLGGFGAFWEADLSRAVDVMRQCVVSHLLTAQHAARLMVPAKRGLIVEVTEGDGLGGSGNVMHDMVCNARKLLVFRMSEELRKHRVAAVCVTPGYLRSESMLAHYGVTEETWRDGIKQDPFFANSETPWFIGRAVAALAADPKVMARSGQLTSSWELAAAYDVRDADGSRPDLTRAFAREVIPNMAWLREGFERQVAWLERVRERVGMYLEVS